MKPVKGEWIRTFAGKMFTPLNANIEDICIKDIAHALSLICRYNGHCREFLSVGQHSCMVSDYIPEFKLEGLLHDGTEAYLGDMVRPVKHSPKMRQYRMAESKLDVLIHEKFDLDPAARKLVKIYDNRALATEMTYLFDNRDIPFEPLPVKRFITWSPMRAEKEFLKRGEKLYTGREK